MNLKLIFVLGICLLFASELAEAQVGFSGTTGSARFVQYGPTDFRSYYGQKELRDYWPILYEGGENSCASRQDLIIQVSPAGCQPAVVRSDLLAEQNVPVFCQLDAFRVNPFIDVTKIKNIRFSFPNGQKPKEVLDVGFHPAQAALQTRNELVGSPFLTNIGYLVVVLKRAANESSMPSFVNFTLNAQLEFKAQNAFGVGRSSFLLTPVDDVTWENERARQSFAGGKYSVRLENADSENARVSIYHEDRKMATTSVKRGGTSGEIYLEGGYCQARIQVAYDSYKSAERTVRLQVDDDILELNEGSRFLNDKCSVSSIIVSGHDSGRVKLSCGGSIELRLAPKSLGVNDEVIKTGKPSDKYIITRIVQPDSSKVTETSYLIKPVAGGKEETIAAGLVEAVSSEKLTEVIYAKDIEEAFEQTIKSYQELARSYPHEKNDSGAGAISFGEQGLMHAIELARDMKKQRTEIELIDEYLQNYPEGARAEDYSRRASDVYRLDMNYAVAQVEIDNDAHNIHLISVREPSKSASAEFDWGGKSLNVGLHESGGFSELGNFTVKSMDADSVTITPYCREIQQNGQVRFVQKSSVTLRIGRDGVADARRTEEVCRQILTLESLNVEQFAQIRILPSVSNAQVKTNVTVGVGVEKRAIKLTPDKTRERVDELNKTIRQWEQISNNLGNVVKGMKAACLGTAGVLTVKNFVTGLSGEALARQKVMRSSGGWTDWCKDRLGREYNTMTECFNAHSSEISSSVRRAEESINKQNQAIKTIEGRDDVRSSSGVFGDSVDSGAAANLFAEQQLGKYGNENINISGENVAVGELVEPVDGKRPMTYDEAKEMAFYLDMRSQATSEVERDLASENLEKIGRSIKGRKDFREEVGSLPVSSYSDKGALKGTYSGKTISDWQNLPGGRISGGDFGPGAYGPDTPSEVVHYNGKFYLVTFGDRPLANGNYQVTNAYELRKDGDVFNVVGEKTDVITSRFGGAFKKVTRDSCVNSFKNPKVQFYETGIYKGYPAIVPFDVERGWYAGIRETVPALGGLKPVQANGRPVSYWVCNVGVDGEEDFFVSGFDDDICQRFDVETGAPLDKFSCLSEGETKDIVARAQQAITEAARKRESGRAVGSIVINGHKVDVGAPATNLPGVECQDFMSPEDCKLLFNVCDPVICPASRCNFGGLYPVNDVIQSGVVGSALLCLPNFNEGVYIPVCLTGIKAGIDGYLSILKSHQQCLSESLESGKYVGTCDLVTSVYMCEFFWRQAAPLANALLPKLIDFAYGQGQARGGGEYMTAQSAWDNAQGSVNYFTQSYASNALNAYKVRSVDEAGTEVCRAFVSAKAPTQFKSLIEPDSPPQFNAWFSKISYTEATVPATAQYKVFYHIFAGNDQGVNFNVYLKDPPQGSYYQSQQSVVVASGFVGRGQYATETRDFTAPDGYQQLCVRINDREECGFKQVSTSFAVNYVRDQLVANELNRTGITSSKACVSGQVNPSALLNPNFEEAAQEGINPEIYNRGVSRICATDNPGKSTEPGRFLDVGYCDDSRVRCWLDTKSVDKALTQDNVGTRNATLNELQSRAKNDVVKAAAGGEYFVDSAQTSQAIKQALDNSAGGKINAKDVASAQRKISALEEIEGKAVFNEQRAQIIFVRSRVYEEIARLLHAGVLRAELKEDDSGKKTSEDNAGGSDSSDSSGGQNDDISSSASVVYELKLNSVEDRYLIYRNGEQLDIYRKNNLIYGRLGYFDSIFGSDSPIATIVDEKIKFAKSYNDVSKFLSQEHYNELNGATIEGNKIVLASSIIDVQVDAGNGTTGQAEGPPQE